MFEHRRQPLLSLPKFLRRLSRFALTAFGLVIASLAVGILGPPGLVRGCPVEKWFRDVRVFDILEGTGQILRRMVGKEMSGFNPE